jgi:hypothetical protein
MGCSGRASGSFRNGLKASLLLRTNTPSVGCFLCIVKHVLISKYLSFISPRSNEIQSGRLFSEVLYWRPFTMSASYKFKESFIFVLLRLIINYTMSKAVCPSLAMSYPIPTRQRRVPDRPVVYTKILSFSIVDVTSELLVIQN